MLRRMQWPGFLVGLMVFFLLAAGAGAASPADFTYTVSGGEATITGYTGPGGNVAIPAELGGYPVRAIGFSAFAYKTLTSVTIPDSVTSIGDYAFYHNQLTSAAIGSGVTSIGLQAFANNQLTSVTIPDSVTSIGFFAFNSNQLTSVTLPSGITSLGDNLFALNQLTSMTIPGSVTTIGNWVFANNQLSSLSVPSSVTSIGVGAFYANNLTALTMVEGITVVGEKAFAGNLLTDAAIPAGVTQIHTEAFKGNLIHTAKIPDSVAGIGADAFGSNQAIPGDLIIFGVRGSAAETYAVDNGHTFRERLLRIAGPNRFMTAVEISREGWPRGANVVLLARADDFADALTGVPLAYRLNCPILLTSTKSLNNDSLAEILRLGAKRVIILGGTAAVSDAVKDTLVSHGLTVERIAGDNRYHTAALIAQRLREEGAAFNTAFIAVGTNFPDALAASSYAAMLGQPILLTATHALPMVTSNALTSLGITSTVACGGESAISAAVFSLLPNPQRIGGANRYETAVELAKAFLSPAAKHVCAATGLNFPDAITGGVLAARMRTGVILVRGDQKVPNPVVQDFVKTWGVRSVALFGGSNAVSDGIKNWFWYNMAW